MNAPRPSAPITIVGAGPAGLAAAITLARAGQAVVLHERYAEVEHRFRRDMQGLENWRADLDVLDFLEHLGLHLDFEHVPCLEGTVFDAWGQAHPVRSGRPLFYLIERGAHAGSLDAALLAQALGVDIRFNSCIERLPGPGILATGPKAADAIAVGYHFETSMPSGFWVICDERVAPGGYAYVAVLNGRGTPQDGDVYGLQAGARLPRAHRRCVSPLAEPGHDRPAAARRCR